MVRIAYQERPLEGLHLQIGAEYVDMRRFKRSALAALKKIALVYPALKLEATSAALIIRPSACEELHIYRVPGVVASSTSLSQTSSLVDAKTSKYKSASFRNATLARLRKKERSGSAHRQ